MKGDTKNQTNQSVGELFVVLQGMNVDMANCPPKTTSNGVSNGETCIDALCVLMIENLEYAPVTSRSFNVGKAVCLAESDYWLYDLCENLELFCVTSYNGSQGGGGTACMFRIDTGDVSTPYLWRTICIETLFAVVSTLLDHGISVLLWSHIIGNRYICLSTSYDVICVMCIFL